MRILSHRGIDLDSSPQLPESSIEAFTNCLILGHGFEFDLQMTLDGQLVVWHDSDLKRWSGGKTAKTIRECSWAEIQSTTDSGAALVSLRALLNRVARQADPGLIALHLKANNQVPVVLDSLIELLGEFSLLHSRLLIFDVLLATGEVLRQRLPRVRLGLSVAHKDDITRFGSLTGGTLYTIDTAVKWLRSSDWLWLDEWDRKDVSGREKALYTPEVFQAGRAAGLNLAVISPELHKGHPDGQSGEVLYQRWKELVNLGPDAICTDFPSRLGRLGPHV